jgi:cytochrome c
LALVVFLVACSQASAPSAPPPPPAPKPIPAEPAPDPAVLQALSTQVEQGKQLFAEQCASCHGDTGQGTDDGPALVGKTVLPELPREGAKRTAVFRTAADVLAFAAENMPADDPGSLAPDQYAAVIAFILRVNGIKLDTPIDAAVAVTIVMH